MKPFLPFFRNCIILGLVFFFQCSEKPENLSPQDKRLIQTLEEENQKVHKFLMQTEGGMPSVQGVLGAVYSLESSSDPTVAGLAKSMKETLQKIERKDQEKDYLLYSRFSQDLEVLVKAVGLENVYKFYCPMNKKYWVDRGDKVKNPYSPEMRDCGEKILE